MAGVLLVDDNLDQLDLRRMILEREGFEVATASTAADALALCEGARAVVMDLRLPTLDAGRALIRSLRSQLPEAVLIILAGVPEELHGHPEVAMVDHLLRKGSGTGRLLQLLPNRAHLGQPHHFS